MDVWLFENDGEVDFNRAATDEMAQVTWMTREQIKELFEHNMFVETLKYFLRKWISSNKLFMDKENIFCINSTNIIKVGQSFNKEEIYGAKMQLYMQ